MKKILVLGGTMFIGRMLTEKLIALGTYEVTLFNRGKANTDIFKDVKQIHGDRETADIEKIYNQHWDCIIDFSGYHPATFEKLLKNIQGNVGRYIFISTVSVFDIEKHSGQLITEQLPTRACSKEQMISPLWDAYGEKKAEMERILMQHHNLDKIIFRPSFIYGKYDWTERFYYWLYRVQNCNKFLLPDNGTPRNLSLTNADDLIDALLMAIEIGSHATIYNTVSTPAISIRQLLHIASTAYGKNPEIITVGEKQLKEHALQLSQFPLVMPIDFSTDDSLWKKDFPFERKDIATTLLEMWDYKANSGYPLPAAGLNVAKEQEIIGQL